MRSTEPRGMLWWHVKSGSTNAQIRNAFADAKENLNNLEALVEADKLRDVFYYVGKAPVTEIVEESFGDPEKPYASITRNRYGALVLNAPSVFFADIDITIKSSPPLCDDSIINSKEYSSANLVAFRQLKDEQKKWDFLEKLTGAERSIATMMILDGIHGGGEDVKTRYEKEVTEKHENAMNSFSEFHKNNPSLSFRVYKTAAGYRLIVTSQTMETSSEQSSAWLKALNSDKLYSRLCEQQECYLARLTPKPWRLPDFKRPVAF